MAAVIDADAFRSFLSWNHARAIIGVFRRNKIHPCRSSLPPRSSKIARRVIARHRDDFSFFSDGFDKIERIVVLLFRRHLYGYFLRDFREFPRCRCRDNY